MVDKLFPTPTSASLSQRVDQGAKPEAARSGAENGLMRRLMAHPGVANAVRAEVQSSSPVSAEQRQQLINRLVDTLLQWQASPDSPRKVEQMARLAEERQLLNSPLLKLVRVAAQEQTAITYTDRPLRPGQSLSVYVSEGRLWLAASDAGRQSTTGTEAPRLPEPVNQALRRALPLRDQPDLAPALPRLQSLSQPQQREIFTPGLQQALREAARQVREPQQLIQPGAMRRAVAENGLQLEQRLFRALQAGKADTPARPAPERPAAGDTARAESVARVLTTDWKGTLLKVLQQVRVELGRQGLSPEAPRSGQQQDLSSLLQQLTARPAPDNTERGSLRTQLLQAVQQLTLHSLARVQFQQSQALAPQPAQAEPGQAQPAQTLNLEVPLRLGQEVEPLLLRLEPETEDDPDTPGSTRVRQWQVQLSFELPGAGPVYALLTVRQQQVATRLWAEHPPTAKAIQNQLDELQQRMEKDGIEVTRLECHTGAPPRPMNDIRYSLVDITT